MNGKFDEKDEVKKWRNLANTEMGRGSDEAMEYIYQEIREKLEGKDINVGNGETDKCLIFAIGMFDGKFSSEETQKTHQYAEILGKMGGVVILGAELTKTANNIPVVFNAEYSRGDYADNFNDLPVIVAKYLA